MEGFFDRSDLAALAQGKVMFGVSFAADGTSFCYAVGVAVEKDETPPVPDLHRITLSAGAYAVSRNFGPVSALPSRFDAMFSDWLPTSDHVQRGGAVFERYPPDPRNGADGMAYEIWVPVAPKP